MKKAKTKEKMKKFAKEISRDAELIQSLGLGITCKSVPPSFLYEFPEKIQEFYEKAPEQEEFLEQLRRMVRDEVITMLSAKKVTTIKLVKYYCIFTQAELKSLFSKAKIVSCNLKRLIIINEIEKLLENTVQTKDEDQQVAKAVDEIYKSL